MLRCEGRVDLPQPVSMPARAGEPECCDPLAQLFERSSLRPRSRSTSKRNASMSLSLASSRGAITTAVSAAFTAS
jgi:hypothetical protein